MAQIIWTLPALEDLDAIADYISLVNPQAAKRIVQRVTARIEMLATFPNLGFTPRDLEGTRYRQLVEPPCHIYYRVEEDTVYIVYIMRNEREFRLIDLVRRDM